MKAIFKIIALAILIFLVSCEQISGYKYNNGSLPVIPTNLSDFNTEYDDYNSTAPSLGYLIPFCFSTNRNTFGQQFDIIYRPMNVNFDKTSGELTVSDQYANWSSIRDDYEVIKFGIQNIKTSGNEFGPNLIIDRNVNEINFTLMYSTDVNGNSQIYYTSNRTEESFSEPKEVAFLKSNFEDMYPSFNSDKSKLYFCSTRNNEKFDFFSVDLNPSLDTESLLSDTSTLKITLESFLSSTANDKCPFIFENKMVFASDRDGGYGGYDLYYSDLENGEWSKPQNFGADINTQSDEFRPILIDEGVSSQIMMVFSSNRLGGKGGYDLYYVGIDDE